ncbi:RNA 2',3'-cyclic phosphodiesterase [Candidatus Pacearchaeota archaeon]|nr:RNA 2',3'-cyclic phosphodiesterase [Candidatus Pacearchaeota archaeon]
MRAYLGIDISYVDVKLDDDFSDLQKVKSQHLTLYFWNDLSDVEAKEISEKLKSYKHNSFLVDVEQAYSFPNKSEPYLVALQFSSLKDLVELREDILSYLELKSEEKFEPHITLYRKQKLDSSFKKSKEFLQEIPEVEVQISNIALYSSEPQKGLNEYKLLEKRILF